MVKTSPNKIDLEHVDFSIIPSLKCNLHCSFCMYDCSMNRTEELDYDTTEVFLKTVDWDRINSWGFYGGEPSINSKLYDKFISLIPTSVNKFVITNGTWSTATWKWKAFLEWCVQHELRIVISGTPEHRQFQDATIVDKLRDFGGITVKDDDEIHPMGRARKEEWTCTQKCLYHLQPIRLGLFPSGDIVLQNCDGVYPVVGCYKDTFNEVFINAQNIRLSSCGRQGRNINDVLDEMRDGVVVARQPLKLKR